MPVPNSKPKRSTNPILAALQVLRKIAPPQTLIHIGAGAGAGDMQEWQEWQVPSVWIIDANANRLQWAETLVTKHSDWHVASAVLSETEGETDFHRTSNPDEDSLIAPEHLQPIWPSLKRSTSELRPVRRLDNLLAETTTSTPALWLFIDCLPALDIIKSAGNYLSSCSVLWLRTLLNPLSSVSEGATLQAVELFLQPLGFRCIEITESNHPAVGHALFVRDWHISLQPQIEQLNKSNAEQSKLASERLIQIEQVTKTRSEQTKLATELQQQLDAFTKAKAALEQEKAALVAKRDELQKEITAITTIRDQQVKLAADSHAQVAELIEARDEQNKLVSEQQVLIGKLSEENDEQTKLARDHYAQVVQLTKSRDELAKITDQLKFELEQAKNQVKGKDEQINQLEVDILERDARQQMLSDEMTRAEAQIDLIKDVLFREPGL